MSIPEAFISSVRLRALLPGLTISILEAWHASGYLVAARYNGHQPQYAVPSVDALLAKVAQGFTCPPTIRALALREANLIGPPDKAAVALRMPAPNLLRLINRGYLPRLCFDSLCLVAYSASDPELPISYVEALLLTGRTPPALHSLIVRDVLRAVNGQKHLPTPSITWGSLESLLREELPSFISPIEWRSRRLSDSRNLLRRVDIIRRLRISAEVLNGLLGAEALWYIKIPGKTTKCLIEPKSVDSYLHRVSGQFLRLNDDTRGLREWYE